MTDGPYFSPDGGHFWVKDGTAYWEDGSVMKDIAMCIFRYMPYEGGEDYSQWTDNHRAGMRAEYERKRDACNAKQLKQEGEWKQLRESAREKITEKEYDAILEEGREYV